MERQAADRQTPGRLPSLAQHVEEPGLEEGLHREARVAVVPPVIVAVPGAKYGSGALPQVGAHGGVPAAARQTDRHADTNGVQSKHTRGSGSAAAQQTDRYADTNGVQSKHTRALGPAVARLQNRIREWGGGLSFRVQGLRFISHEPAHCGTQCP
jgi:hypothetical protein